MTCNHPDGKRPLYVARGIFCCYVCDRCEATRKREFRPDIFDDPDYETSEDVEEI